jgi:hypothetical protein
MELRLWRVLSDKDAPRGGILRGLATMREAMAKSEPGRDLAVFYFSGHGALIDGEFYLLPQDVDVGDPVAITTTALPTSMLRRQLEGLGQYGRVLVLLDARRSGGAMANGQALTVDAARLRRALVGPNITVLTSSTSAQLSRENPDWGNGAFTEIFLEALGSRADANKNGLISLSELTQRNSRQSSKSTSEKRLRHTPFRVGPICWIAGYIGVQIGIPPYKSVRVFLQESPNSRVVVPCTVVEKCTLGIEFTGSERVGRHQRAGFVGNLTEGVVEEGARDGAIEISDLGNAAKTISMVEETLTGLKGAA